METFVVRVWRPGEEEAGAEERSLHGVIERVGDPQPTPFRNESELLAALRAGRETTPSDREAHHA